MGVFRNEAPGRVVEIVNSIGLKAAQLHGDETTEQSPVGGRADPPHHQGLPGRASGHRADRRVRGRFVLVDADSPGSGEVFDWRLAEGVADPARLIVSGGLRAENVADAIAHLHPYGVDVSSGVESAPGRKDPVKLRAFVAAARAAAGEDGPEAGDEAGVDGLEASGARGSGPSTGGKRADDHGSQ